MNNPNTAASDSRPAIAFADVHFSHRQAPVVLGFRWQVPAGATAALFGLTGAGKSTLLALAAGALSPSAGQVTIEGRSPLTASTRRLLGYMPQSGGLYTDLSVEENLRVFAAGAGLKGRVDDAITRTLDLMALNLKRRERVRDLSAGQQQRVSLGAALVGSPQVLLLDEPLSLADPIFAAEMWSHFQALAKQGRTILVATSQPQTAGRAEHVAVVRGGRLSTATTSAALAPGGRGTVVLHYRPKTGPIFERVAVENYRAELAALVTGATAKPVEIEVLPETLETRLEALLLEEPGHAAHRP